MKSGTVWIVLLLFGWVLLQVCTLASADGGPDYYAVTGVAAEDVLNIRAKPSAESKKVGEIPHDGRGIQNLGCTGVPSFAEWQKMTEAEREQAGRHRWCKVRYQGIVGWVAGRYLMEDSNPPAAGVPASPEDGGPRDWEVMRALNLREEPSTTARTIASYSPGTILDNLGCQRAEDRIWCDVQPLGGGPRGYVSAEYLRPAVSPDGSVAKGPDDSALRAGQGQFDATGTIPCAEHKGQPMRQCEFGVARAGGGYATVVVKKPDGRTRVIFFRMGKPIGADTSQADGYPQFSATKENDLNLISIGDERYEIPDAVVLGG